MSLYKGIELPNRPDPENIRRLDLLPLPQIARMMRVGVAIDPPRLHQLTSDFTAKASALRKDITSLIPEEKLNLFVSDSDSGLPDLNPQSSIQTAELLFEVLGIGKGRNLKRTSTGLVSTGKKQLEAIKLDHPVVQLILDYRGLLKLVSTYTSALPLLAKIHPKGPDCPLCGRHHYSSHPRVHTQILTTRTDTGRLASKGPNLNNIPARTDEGRLVREGFVASEGMKLVDVDYAQIELRGVADQSGDENMIRIFQADGDIHTDTAMRAFGLENEKQVDKLLHRAPCKNVNFGVCYGLGPLGLYDLMAVTYATAKKPLPDWVTVDWCQSFITQWFGLYPACGDYFQSQHLRALRWGIVWTPAGRVRRIPEVYSAHSRVREAGLRQAGNMPIQGFAADIFKLGLSRVEDRFRQLREFGVDVEALLPIHDEVLVEVEEDWAEEVLEVTKEEMALALVDEKTGVLQCKVPITTDGKVSNRWSKD